MPLSNLVFRKATPSDVAPLLTLVQSAYRGDASREGWTHEADIFTSGDRIGEAGLLAKIGGPRGQVLVVVADDDDPASCGSTTTTTTSASAPLACCEVVGPPAPGGPAYFGLFAVRPGLQNRGLGRRLLAEAERLARDELGAGAMEMTTLWMRAELIAWYGRRGYGVVEGETRPFPFEELGAGPPRDDLYFIVLRKELLGGSVSVGMA